MGYRFASHSLVRQGRRRIRLLKTKSNGVFVADWRVGAHRYRHSLETEDETEAVNKAKAILKQLERSGTVSTRNETVIYVIQQGNHIGPIKVGISRNVDARLRALQTANAEPLRLLATFTMAQVERAIHAELEHDGRLQGEWFPVTLLPVVYSFFNVPVGIALERHRKRLRAKVHSSFEVTHTAVDSPPCEASPPATDQRAGKI